MRRPFLVSTSNLFGFNYFAYTGVSLPREHHSLISFFLFFVLSCARLHVFKQSRFGLFWLCFFAHFKYKGYSIVFKPILDI